MKDPSMHYHCAPKAPPSVRYSQEYYSYGTSYYSSYLSRYYSVYVPESYKVNGDTYNEGAGGNVCKNYQINENGTVLGMFQCPLEFEPSTHTYCCGKKELEYCCLPKHSPTLYAIIFGSLAAVAFTIAFIAISVKLYYSSQMKALSPSNGMTTSQPAPMTQQYSLQQYSTDQQYTSSYGNDQPQKY